MGLVPDDRSLTFIPFRDNEMVAVAAPGHALVDAPSISLLRLAEETLLVREAGSGTRKAFEAYCLQQGVLFPRRQQLGSLEAVKRGAQAQLGVAVLPREAVAGELADGRLCALDVKGLPLRP